MNIDISPNTALRLVLGAQAFCIALSTSELLVCGELTRKNSFHSFRHLTGMGRESSMALSVSRVLPLLITLRLLAAILLVAAVAFNVFLPHAVLALATVSSILAWYKIIGGDGAEQMAFIVITAAAFTAIAGFNDNHVLLFLFFVAGQASLAYLTAGIAKLVSPTWRSGVAITRIVSASSYGTPWCHRTLTSLPLLGVAICWATIIWESLFPIALCGNHIVTVAVLAIGILFHVGCAIIMGLNDFVWAFVGTYPAVIIVSQRIGEWFASS